MNCRETQQMIDRYLKDTLNDRELQAFLGHIRECPSCYEELEIYYTIHYALDYLDEGRKGGMNPSASLQRELSERNRLLRRSRVFRLFMMIVTGRGFGGCDPDCGPARHSSGSPDSRCFSGRRRRQSRDNEKPEPDKEEAEPGNERPEPDKSGYMEVRQ